MFKLVQLEDDNFRLTIDIRTEDGQFSHYEWTFAVTESDAPEKSEGIKIEVK